MLARDRRAPHQRADERRGVGSRAACRRVVLARRATLDDLLRHGDRAGRAETRGDEPVDRVQVRGQSFLDRLPACITQGPGVLREGFSCKTELAERYIEVNLARMMSYRVATMQAKGMIPSHEASMSKLFSSELTQRISRTGMKVLGLYGQLWGDEAPMKGRYESSYMTSLASTIAGGTSEIQRNIIAQRGLGLPRD